MLLRGVAKCFRKRCRNVLAADAGMPSQEVLEQACNSFGKYPDRYSTPIAEFHPFHLLIDPSDLHDGRKMTKNDKK